MEKNCDRKNEFVFIKFFEKDENIWYEIQGRMKPQPIHYNIIKTIKKIQHTKFLMENDIEYMNE